MKVKIIPSSLRGIIPGISAKSCLHRQLIAAALSQGETTIGHHGLSNDVMATVSAIAAFAGTTLGVKFIRQIAENHGFSMFGVYCWGMALFIFILNLMA